MSKKIKKQLSINVKGTEYPYIETMGALLSFNRETGLDMPVNLEDNLKYMYHALSVPSTARARKRVTKKTCRAGRH